MTEPSRESRSSLGIPRAWYYACSLAQLSRGPVDVNIGNRHYVVFATASGKRVAMNRACIHMGSSLANGQVCGERIRCSFHGWEFDEKGICQNIPGSKEIPAFAKQSTFPVEVRGQNVFLFNSLAASHDLPVFDNVSIDELQTAPALTFEVDAPWEMIGANAFDLQHFRFSHDRRLLAEPLIDSPSRFSRRCKATFEVIGSSLADRITRAFSGRRSVMTMTIYAGVLAFVVAEFPGSVTFGQLCVTPLTQNRSRLHLIVSVPRRQNLPMRLLDPLDALIRRAFIYRFLLSDRLAIRGTRYNPATLSPADQPLRDYFDWLREISMSPFPRHDNPNDANVEESFA